MASAVPGGGGLVQDAPCKPADDIEETDDAYVLELELPGLRKDQGMSHRIEITSR
ncbi:hypothetical protein [Streptomyces sp. NPDC054787]